MSDDVKPWDLLNPREPRTEEELKAHRLSICESCEHFRQTTRTCRLCGCFMDLKATLDRAKCPAEKW
jgi:ribosomal protein L32